MVQYEDGIVDPKVQQWIAEHQTAMNKDEHKYIDNPAYAAIQSKLNQAKSIYDWGNSAVGLPNNSNKTQWQHNYPHPELTFDTNGVGYKDGQTYLPGRGSNGFIVPGPSNSSTSQNYSYVPTTIPDKQILRTEFPTPQTISKDVYETEKQRAAREYINNNTRKEYLISPAFLFHRGLEVEDVDNYFGRNLEYAPSLNKKVIQDMKSQGLNLNNLVWEQTPLFYKQRRYMPFPVDYQTAKTLQTNAINGWIDDEIEMSKKLGSDRSEVIKYWTRWRDTNGGIRSITTKPSTSEAEQNAQINYGNLTNNIFAKGGPIKHTIAKGETLSSISKKYGVPISVIQQANGLTSDKIIAGNTLTIIPPIQSVNFMQDVARNSTPVNPTTRNNNVVSDRNKVVQGQRYYDNATPYEQARINATKHLSEANKELAASTGQLLYDGTNLALNAVPTPVTNALGTAMDIGDIVYSANGVLMEKDPQEKALAFGNTVENIFGQIPNKIGAVWDAAEVMQDLYELQDAYQNRHNAAREYKYYNNGMLPWQQALSNSFPKLRKVFKSMPSGGLENQVNPNTLENQYAKGGIITHMND